MCDTPLSSCIVLYPHTSIVLPRPLNFLKLHAHQTKTDAKASPTEVAAEALIAAAHAMRAGAEAMSYRAIDHGNGARPPTAEIRPTPASTAPYVDDFNGSESEGRAVPSAHTGSDIDSEFGASTSSARGQRKQSPGRHRASTASSHISTLISVADVSSSASAARSAVTTVTETRTSKAVGSAPVAAPSKANTRPTIPAHFNPPLSPGAAGAGVRAFLPSEEHFRRTANPPRAGRPVASEAFERYTQDQVIKYLADENFRLEHQVLSAPRYSVLTTPGTLCSPPQVLRAHRSMYSVLI